jgi:predicted HicB family RNase H-like nuclease
MPLSIKQHINKVIKEKAKIGYDKSVNQWFGVLNHVSGLIYSQGKSRSYVKKDLAESLEEFIALYFEKNLSTMEFGQDKTSKIQRTHCQA